jgi:GNAT superfamily N-acetyltransferase
MVDKDSCMTGLQVESDWAQWVRWCHADVDSSFCDTFVDSLRQLSRASEYDRPIIALHVDEETFEAAGYLVLHPGAYGVIGKWRYHSRSEDGAHPHSLDHEVSMISGILKELCQFGFQAGAEVVQHIAAVDPDELDIHPSGPRSHASDPTKQSLLRSGMNAIATLVQMERWSASGSDVSITGNGQDFGLSFHPWSQIESRQALQLVERTYIGTLDVPELNGVRSTARTLEGYRGQTKDAEDRWWGVQRESRWVGCLILSRISCNSIDDAWELTYLGIVPESRGIGLSRPILQFAVDQALAAGASRLALAVDVRNTPALQLYRSFGFVPTQFVQAWVKASGASTISISPLRQDSIGL